MGRDQFDVRCEELILQKKGKPSPPKLGRVKVYVNPAGKICTIDGEGTEVNYTPPVAAGDMEKSIYDPNDDGVVDFASAITNGSGGLGVDGDNSLIPLSGSETLGSGTTAWPGVFTKHLNTGGAKPSVSAGSSATASGTAELSANSTDGSGTLTVTTGVDDPVAAGLIAAITFIQSFIDGPRPTFTPKNAAAADIKIYADTTANAVSLFNSSSSLLSANTTYIWDYTVVGPATANPGA